MPVWAEKDFTQNTDPLSKEQYVEMYANLQSKLLVIVVRTHSRFLGQVEIREKLGLYVRKCCHASGLLSHIDSDLCLSEQEG